jgi:hypothetical protein
MTVSQRAIQAIVAAIVPVLAACVTTQGPTLVAASTQRIEFEGFSILQQIPR